MKEGRNVLMSSERRNIGKHGRREGVKEGKEEAGVKSYSFLVFQFIV